MPELIIIPQMNANDNNENLNANSNANANAINNQELPQHHEEKNSYNNENLHENPYDNIINEIDHDFNKGDEHAKSSNPSNEVEDKLLSKMDPKLSSHNSEKMLAHTSQIVNQSEDNNRQFKLVEQNENRTENEFVFSENVNIDTLSYNEPFLESTKKKHEEDDKKAVK